METGLTQGFHGHVAYEWYYARDSVYGYADYESLQTSPDGTNHSYEVDNGGGGVYYAYRDGSLLLGASGLGTSGICIAQVGSELTSVPNGNYYSATFDQTPLLWRDTSWVLHTGWNTSESWIDYPCGQGQNPAVLL
jgi:hypothetical protein